MHVGALLPLLWLLHAVPGGLLGGDPVQGLMHYFGIGALRLLLLALLVSPLARALSASRLLRLRRPLGLWSFAWASLHVATWSLLDLGLDWRLIGAELVERTFILLGFAAWLILAVLALTSIPALARALGRRWKPLHQLVHVAALLVCAHYWWSVKSGWVEPASYLALTLLLLALRGRRLWPGLSRRRPG